MPTVGDTLLLKYQKLPILMMFAGKDKSGANKYSFSHVVMSDDNTKQNRELSLGSKENSLPKTPAEKDVFSSSKGLGPTRWKVWRHLCDKPEPSIASIARAIGLKPSNGTANKALIKLLELGLVTHTNGMYYGVHKTEVELEYLSAVLDVLGRSEKQERKHTKDREKRANRLMASERKKWAENYQVWRELDETNGEALSPPVIVWN